MEAVITGDLINSRKAKDSRWVEQLKLELQVFGEEFKDWELYRGDSFQLLLPANQALSAVFRLKSNIKQFADLDVRIAIGVGEVDFRAERVLESNGTAFQFSGEGFDNLNKQNLMVNSANSSFNQTLNIMFSLASLVMDYWKPVTAQIINSKLKNPELTQKELAVKLGKKSQASISEGLKRGGFEEIENLNKFYKGQLLKI